MKDKNKKAKKQPVSDDRKFDRDGDRRRKLQPMPKEKFDWRKLDDEDDDGEEE